MDSPLPPPPTRTQASPPPAYVGQSIPATNGLRVIMAPGKLSRGKGVITKVLDGGSAVAVKWEDGTEEASIATGQDGRYDLVAALAAPNSISAAASPAPTLSTYGLAASPGPPSPPLLANAQRANFSSQPSTLQTPIVPGGLFPTVEQPRSTQPLPHVAGGVPNPPASTGLFPTVEQPRSTQPLPHVAGGVPNPPASTGSSEPLSEPNSAATNQLHKQLLAQEVVKLRKEIQDLRAAQDDSQVPVSDSNKNKEGLSRLRQDIARLERERDEAVQKANTQKALLAKEVKTLREELEAGRMHEAQAAAKRQMEAALSTPVGQALAQRREFEERFTRALRDLRAQLDATSIKALSGSSQAPMGIRTLLQVSNERIDAVLEDATRVPVEERLHIECLRIVIENAKLRKALNEYAQGLLSQALVKDQRETSVIGAAAPKTESKSFFGLFV